MKTAILGFFVLSFGFSVGWARMPGTSGASVNASEDSASDDCSEHLQSHDRQYQAVARGEESRNLPNQPLEIRAERNGGIQISTWDKPEFMVKLCKQVAGDSDSEAKRVLAATTLAVNGGTVSVNSPDPEGEYNLSTLLLVRAPRDAQVKMTVKNGGISVRGFTGTAEAKATNGGISLKHSTGKLTVHAANGGISIQDCGGDVTADVQNGGLSITLPEQWQGKGLDAHTANGGLVIRVPKSFNSGLEISGSEHVSIVCKGDVCDNAQRTWDNGQRMFRLGSGSPQIRATTINGGIVIKDRDSLRETM
jgi:DUF4097 and DUF4098 domain-containing protein YvlB